jgi:Lamin Tail Domain
MNPKPNNKYSLDVFSLCLAFAFAATGCGPSLDDLDALGIEPPSTGPRADLGSPNSPPSPMPNGTGNTGGTNGTTAPKVSVHPVPDAGSTCSGGNTPAVTTPLPQPIVADAGATPQPVVAPMPDPVVTPTPPPVVTPTLPVASPTPGDLRITEIMVNPAGQDAGFEWFEVLNTTEQTLDLTGLVIADNVRESAVTITAISPGESLLFSQKLLAEGEGVVGGVAYGTAVSFNNDGDSLSLCIGPCATGTVLTRATWGNLGTRYDGHAVQFDTAGAPQCPAEPAIATGGFGTPGQVNPACPL